MPQGRLLIVDDEANVTVTMQAILELDGYAVDTAHQGSTAMRLLTENVYDLLLTDLRLEDTDGLTLLAFVREHSPDTVAIMLTGFASVESAVNALREGAYDYLFKPCEVDELRATVARGMERRQLQRALDARMRDLEAANGTIRTLNVELQSRVEAATEQLQQRMEELARANEEIAALYRDSQKHVARLEELDMLKSRFLSMASHELKTPLTSVSGLAQMLLRRSHRRQETGPPTSEDWHEEQQTNQKQLQLLKEQTARLVRLVDELLDVSRIESGKLQYRMEPVDVQGLLQDVVERTQLTAMDHTLRLTVSSAGGMTVQADRDHLEQVLNNLLGNAIKYSPSNREVEITVQTEGDDVVIGVRDYGTGIRAGELEAVFGLFYQAPDSVGRKGGMGLGLYISREIVSRLGGRIWAEHASGEGSTFFVSLPREPAASPATLASG